MNESGLASKVIGVGKVPIPSITVVYKIITYPNLYMNEVGQASKVIGVGKVPIPCGINLT